MIDKICPLCTKVFRVWPSHSRRKYCSKICFDTAQATAERKIVTCEKCGEKFTTKKDHGAWPKFCSRECFEKDAFVPIEKECLTCGSVFLAGRSAHTSDGVQIFCSNECRNANLRNGATKICVFCGGEFYVPSGRDDVHCSAKCRYAHLSGENNPQWEGGRYTDSGSGQIRIYAPRENVKSKYLAEHRVIAAKVLGRFLDRTEMMLHINDRQDDNREENLFICASIGEMRRRRNGTLPWPKESNLKTYGKGK